MNRRCFIAQGSLAAAGAGAARARGSSRPRPATIRASKVGPVPSPPRMRNWRVSTTLRLSTLLGNAVQFPSYPEPVLVEGSVYHGVWLECAPQEGEVYDAVGPETARRLARNNHLIFFALQKDGRATAVQREGPADRLSARFRWSCPSRRPRGSWHNNWATRNSG